MKTFNTILEAQEAAQTFFKENFGYVDGVGINSASEDRVEFYSKDDSGMDDTFECLVHDGYNRSCKNGGEVITTEA